MKRSAESRPKSAERKTLAREGEARGDRERPTQIQDEPESTIGRKPLELEHPERPHPSRSRG